MPTEFQFTPDQTISDIARALPEAISVFEEAEIDFSCKGAQSLEDAASASGYRVEEIIDRLNRTKRRNGQKNWHEESLSALMSFLIDDHAKTISSRLPSIRANIESAIEAHRNQAEELDRIRILFQQLSSAIMIHVTREERELFPYIRDLELAGDGSIPVMRIAQRVLREFVEHETFYDRLRTMFELAERLPDDEANTALRNDVRQFQKEVHRHMHLENNVLYPRAIDIENELRRTGTA